MHSVIYKQQLTFYFFTNNHSSVLVISINDEKYGEMINWWKYSYRNASLEKKKRWPIIHIPLTKKYIHKLEGGDEK